ncbi:hypothetical protein EDB85DRAFT_1886862 [Lactarius pseudohatsudake]|nr:hypothetical protein EDB85DRAFT_1886862 [Lactarius pseudohatsudake]
MCAHGNISSWDLWPRKWQLLHGPVSPLSSALPLTFVPMAACSRYGLSLQAVAMPGVIFVIGFALLAFAYDLCAQGCALPFRSPPRAAHRGFFLNAIGSLPVRGRTVVLSGQALPLPMHIHWFPTISGLAVPLPVRGKTVIFDRIRWDVRGVTSSSQSFHLRPTPRYRVFYVLALFSVSIRGSDPAVLFDCDRLLYLLYILSARHQWQRHLSYRLRPLLLQPRSLGCEEFFLLPLRIFNYGSAVIFGVRLPTSRLCGVINSVIFRGVCLLHRQLLMPPPLFRPRSLPSHYPTSGHVWQRLHMGLATFYGIGVMPLISRVGVGLGLAHCRELLAQIGESVKRSRMPLFLVQLSLSRHWVMSSNCPHFRCRGTVTDIRSWTVHVANFGRLSAVSHLWLRQGFRLATSPLLSVHGTGGDDPTYRAVTVSVASLYTQSQDDIRVVHALGITNLLLNAMRLSRAGILGMPVSSSDTWLVSVYVLIKVLDWPATFVCTPCPSVRCDRSCVTLRVQYSSSRWLFGIIRVHAMPFRKMLSVVRYISRSCWIPESSGPRYTSCARRSTVSKDRVCVIGRFTELWASSSWGFQILVSSVPISEGHIVVIACFAR